jgi:hypothetical protein
VNGFNPIAMLNAATSSNPEANAREVAAEPVESGTAPQRRQTANEDISPPPAGYTVSDRPVLLNHEGKVFGEHELTRHEAAIAITLARDVAGLLDYPMDDVWWALCNVPVNMAGLLDTPQGWAMLAAYLAGDLGMGTVDYLPQVH